MKGALSGGRDADYYRPADGFTPPAAAELTRTSHAFEGRHESSTFSGSKVTRVEPGTRGISDSGQMDGRRLHGGNRGPFRSSPGADSDRSGCFPMNDTIPRPGLPALCRRQYS
jgi:hypothetical protein